MERVWGCSCDSNIYWSPNSSWLDCFSSITCIHMKLWKGWTGADGIHQILKWQQIKQSMTKLCCVQARILCHLFWKSTSILASLTIERAGIMIIRLHYTWQKLSVTRHFDAFISWGPIYKLGSCKF